MNLDRKAVVAKCKKANLKLGDLAARIGVAPGTLSAWFAGKQQPTWANLERMCRILDCTVDDIVVYVEESPKAMALA